MLYFDHYDSEELKSLRTAVRPRWGLFLAVVLVLALLAGLLFFLFRPKPDPHAGQVYLYDGFDWIWYTPLEGVEPNPWTAEHFRPSAGGIPTYLNSDYRTLRGIDVSEHQLAIDWAQAARSGLDYAYIRVGRRGYTEGGLFEDPYFTRNIQGAQAAGLQVGVYFFSQAVNVGEAIAEARFVLDRIGSYRIDLPVIYDWEKIPDAENARTNELSLETRTECAIAFCETIRAAGYEPGIYFNRNIGYYGYDLSRLTDYVFWFSLPESPFPNFYYKVDSWQYSFTETVPGIETPTDMNLLFLPVEPEPTSEA